MRKTLLILAIALAVILGPVVIAQLTPSEGRSLSGVSLRETRHEEIAFRNQRQNIDLAGMLFVPEGEGPFPAVAVIHGSGTSVRDNRWYLTLTQYLQQRDIVVLLPDKRGSAKSGGDWRDASFEDLATDTLAAIEYLEQQQDVPLTEIGIVGMSQGGWIAPIVADRAGDVAFVVSMVGAMVTPGEQLLFEENHNLRQMGFLPGISNSNCSLGVTIEPTMLTTNATSPLRSATIGAIQPPWLMPTIPIVSSGTSCCCAR